ncbi:MAG: DUF59 domain-containing protein [Alphaproteobacteria bacterium]|nr:DUF59 domain-containing protein [Alphaproteobacteria bacterium]
MPLSSEISERPTDQDFINALKTVEDPDLGIDVYNLGLIYNITPKENGDVYVDMTLTSPTCPYAEQLLQASADAVADLKGVGEVFVKAVWEPAWTLERLSEEARYDLDLL